MLQCYTYAKFGSTARKNGVTFSVTFDVTFFRMLQGIFDVTF